MNGLKDKVAIVTGGANGIGRACVRRFVQEGAAAVIADINDAAGAKTAEELKAAGHRAAYIRADVSSEAAVKELAEQAVQAFGRIDILVNCAATFILKGINASAEEWARVAATNIAGPAICAKYTVPEMRKVGGGAIVNICSISALIAQSEYLTYSAAKGAMLTMTRCMALDLARDKIRVNAVSPGTVWTEANARFIKQTYGLDRADADKHPEIGGQHLFERTADPEEIASVVAFLASAEASFMTGENVVVDAGYTIR